MVEPPAVIAVTLISGVCLFMDAWINYRKIYIIASPLFTLEFINIKYNLLFKKYNLPFKVLVKKFNAFQNNLCRISNIVVKVGRHAFKLIIQSQIIKSLRTSVLKL